MKLWPDRQVPSYRIKILFTVAEHEELVGALVENVRVVKHAMAAEDPRYCGHDTHADHADLLFSDCVKTGRVGCTKRDRLQRLPSRNVHLQTWPLQAHCIGHRSSSGEQGGKRTGMGEKFGSDRRVVTHRRGVAHQDNIKALDNGMKRRHAALHQVVNVLITVNGVRIVVNDVDDPHRALGELWCRPRPVLVEC